MTPRSTFAPGSLAADAYVLVTQSSDNAFGLRRASYVYELQAGTRQRRPDREFLVAPNLTIFVGRGLPLPLIAYVDPVSGAQTIHLLRPRRRDRHARLPHFSPYTATFVSGAWEITSPDGCERGAHRSLRW